ncbi:helix-turn-helix domain-containing protein [Cytobacillus kochii]|uniref:helix-turn-helix domain-containing protein n=1 Tax=Cytobacillus kochii TaxID=859143 RepID=UPI001CD46C8D|nr:helix-turn-helix domain-containing protein [Cytobacillus kochii]
MNTILSGKELKIKRIIANKKASDIAKYLNVHKSYISKLEKETRDIPIHIYEKWLDYFN